MSVTADTRGPAVSPMGPLRPSIPALGLFGTGLLVGIGEILIVPFPWVTTVFYQFLCEHVDLPDGRRLAYRETRTGTRNVFWTMADGSGAEERLTTGEGNQSPTSWSPDGQALAIVDNSTTGATHLMLLRLSDHKLQPLLHTPFNEGGGQFSPDGRWLAYASDESGRFEVYVQAYPGPGGKWQISTDGGTGPIWNRSGLELFYRSANKLMAVNVTTHPSFSSGKPKMLFEGSFLSEGPVFPSYDVSPGGQRFLMIQPVDQGQTASTQINVVLNWTEELKHLVPTGK